MEGCIETWGRSIGMVIEDHKEEQSTHASFDMCQVVTHRGPSLKRASLYPEEAVKHGFGSSSNGLLPYLGEKRQTRLHITCGMSGEACGMAGEVIMSWPMCVWTMADLLKGTGWQPCRGDDVSELGVAPRCVIGPRAVDHDGLTEVVVRLKDLARSPTFLVEQALRDGSALSGCVRVCVHARVTVQQGAALAKGPPRRHPLHECFSYLEQLSGGSPEQRVP